MGTPEMTENVWLGKIIFDIDIESFQKVGA